MSKKHYQALARAIYEARLESAVAFTSADEVLAHRSGVIAAQIRITRVLAADNPRFDRVRFIEACETGTCKGMPKRARGAA